MVARVARLSGTVIACATLFHNSTN
jgi:hypothetical protein